MKYVKVLGVAFAALFALGISTASSAFALPDVSISLGGAYPLHLEVTLLTLATRLTSVTGTKAKLTGEGLLVLFLTAALTSLGTFQALFLKVVSGEGAKCSSEGDKEGEILTKGTFHLVYTSLSGSAFGLQLGVLFLVELVPLVTCGEEKIKIKGSVIGAIGEAGTEGTELTSLSAVLNGNEKGIPTFNVFYNDEGLPRLAKLESNFGAGFVQTAEETGAAPVTTFALEGKMFNITSR
jgi:hypothetical protein